MDGFFIRKIVSSLWIIPLVVAVSFAPGWCQPQGVSEPAQGSDLAVLRRIDYSSPAGSAKIVLELSKEVPYETRLLKEDPGKKLPPRIYVDLFGARLHTDAGRPIFIQDGLVRQVRTGQFSQDVVRVVLDMNAQGSHKVYALQEPFRLVVEVQALTGGPDRTGVQRKEERVSPGRSKKSGSEWLRKIVLDPGHGGKDPGAIGWGGVMERDVVLALAKKLARKLKKEMGVEVTLTRQDDTFIPLEDRTAIANAENADLFLSLHVNASPNPKARGLETYYLDNTDDEAAIRLAARENATSRRDISDLQFILSDLIQSSKLEDSVSLAHHLQGAVVSHMGQRYGGVVDLGVKKALFYVLVGARMPSVLAEVFFITNKVEGRNLTKPAYQNAVVNALYQGIKKYRDSALVAKNL